MRAGYIRQLGAGIYTLLPLGFRVQQRIEQVIREEIDAIGGQEMEMPVVHPAELWKESGRYAKIGPELVRFKDRGGRDMVLAMTHEEVVADLLRDLVKSYRQLPAIVYHFQTKFRDEPRARGGLIRVREFVMKDSYSLDADEAGLEPPIGPITRPTPASSSGWACRPSSVGADVGIMGGSLAHEFMVLNDARRGHPGPVRRVRLRGEPADRARGRQPEPDAEEPLPTEEVATPEADTIASLAALLGVGTDRTAKAIFFVTGDGRLITAIVRGDFEVNETKLSQRGEGGRRAADRHAEEITAAGMEPGYASPIGAHRHHGRGRRARGALAEPGGRGQPARLPPAQRQRRSRLHAGPGGRHRQRPRGRRLPQLRRSRCTWPRASRSATSSSSAPTSPRSWAPPTWPRTAAGITMVMGSYGIGLGRAMACIVEAHHDEKGIAWPEAVAPYAVHLVALGAGKDPAVAEAADGLYQRLTDAGVEVLYDDRDESPGVKLTDAELLGMPTIVTISPRSLAAGGAEVTERATGERWVQPIADVEDALGARP